MEVGDILHPLLGPSIPLSLAPWAPQPRSQCSECPSLWWSAAWEMIKWCQWAPQGVWNRCGNFARRKDTRNLHPSNIQTGNQNTLNLFSCQTVIIDLPVEPPHASRLCPCALSVATPGNKRVVHDIFTTYDPKFTVQWPRHCGIWELTALQWCAFPTHFLRFYPSRANTVEKKAIKLGQRTCHATCMGRLLI